MPHPKHLTRYPPKAQNKINVGGTRVLEMRTADGIDYALWQRRARENARGELFRSRTGGSVRGTSSKSRDGATWRANAECSFKVGGPGQAGQAGQARRSRIFFFFLSCFSFFLKCFVMFCLILFFFYPSLRVTELAEHRIARLSAATRSLSRLLSSSSLALFQKNPKYRRLQHPPSLISHPLPQLRLEPRIYGPTTTDLESIFGQLQQRSSIL